MSSVKISVIIPVYNGENYLERCLKSLERQTFRDFEIIVVNDGSSDNTEKIIEKYITGTSLIMRSFFQNNSGQAAARNFGLAKAIGDYIAFVDGDDYVGTQYLEQLYTAAVKNQSEVVTCGYRQVDEQGKTVRYVQLVKQHEEPYGPAGIFVVWSKLFKRKFLIDNNFSFQEGGKIFEDVPYSIAAKYLGKNPIAIKYSGYYYVVRIGSTMHSGSVNSDRFPFDKMTEAIRLSVNKTSGEPRDRLEFEILHFFTGFIFRYCRKAGKKDVIRIVDYSREILRSFFPEYYKNRYVGLFRNKEQSFLERCAVAVFVFMNRIKLIRQFAIMITRI